MIKKKVERKKFLRMGVFGDDSDQGILRPAIIKCGQNCRFMDYGSPKMEEQNNYYDRENINYDEYDEDYNDEPSWYVFLYLKILSNF